MSEEVKKLYDFKWNSTDYTKPFHTFNGFTLAELDEWKENWGFRIHILKKDGKIIHKRGGLGSKRLCVEILDNKVVKGFIG
jgi:hypothetical protein